MHKFMDQLGLTPSARARFAIDMPRGPKPWEDDPASEFFPEDDELLAKPWN